MKAVATDREISFKPLEAGVDASESRCVIQAFRRLRLAKRQYTLTAENWVGDGIYFDSTFAGGDLWSEAGGTRESERDVRCATVRISLRDVARLCMDCKRRRISLKGSIGQVNIRRDQHSHNHAQ